MPTLYITKGLPGCGKTTLAKKMQEEDGNLVRVNKDDLRAMLHNSVHSKGRENQVLKFRDFTIRESLKEGHNVIVDDTNFGPHEENLRAIAKEMGAEFKVFDLTDVPPEICIERDLKRLNSVGQKVIMRFYHEYLKPKDEVNKQLKSKIYDSKLPFCVIFDLDGTLACIGDRSPYDGQSCGKDLPNYSIIALNNWAKFIQLEGPHSPLDASKGKDSLKIVIMSGRNGESRPETEAWLKKHGVFYDELHMRKTGDQRKDAIIKEELFNEHVKDKYNVIFVVDDRDQVVKLWRSLGLVCLQCNYGNF